MVAAPNRILDDIARLVTDAAGAAQGMRREVDTIVKSQLEKLLRDLDVVTREDFEAVREMAILAREENDRLAARLAALEARLGSTEAPARPAAAKAARPKAATAKSVKPKA